ncbi:hypothetical protein L6452_30938 [Arctium lappa]|uniref:Uncharacterized protein n=1 Tax=Arctium lappa TaxID=4217 RepID=A0ACB8ZNY1_ARCLA|nr:hypothetical protein L6452_30938 [Arctium lappa]
MQNQREITSLHNHAFLTSLLLHFLCHTFLTSPLPFTSHAIPFLLKWKLSYASFNIASLYKWCETDKELFPISIASPISICFSNLHP